MPELKPSRREGEDGVMLAVLSRSETTVAANAIAFYAELEPDFSKHEKVSGLPYELARASMSDIDKVVLVFEPAKDWERQTVMRDALKAYSERLADIALDYVMDDNPDTISLRDDVMNNAFMANALHKVLAAKPSLDPVQ